jgi:hypothetical protein
MPADYEQRCLERCMIDDVNTAATESTLIEKPSSTEQA